ncbi:MAG: tRNA (N6-threonylcarbamoyladenosine(37)-N6)-methyltransferase TrmO [Methermicoccaceae archaeon]
MHLKAIGTVHTPYTHPADAPNQGRRSGELCTLEVFEEFADGLKDIEQCSHLIVLYWQDRAGRDTLQTITPHGSEVHGVFATRSPSRPNPVALCVVELVEREGRLLKVRGMDALDGSPLLDIKPYSVSLNCVESARIGWHGEGDIKDSDE